MAAASISADRAWFFVVGAIIDDVLNAGSSEFGNVLYADLGCNADIVDKWSSVQSCILCVLEACG